MGEARMSDRFERTLCFIDAIEKAQSTEEAERCLLAFAAGLGFTSIFGGIVPLRPIPLAELPSRIIFQALPNQWAARYNASGYVFRDPVVTHLLHQRTPFTWKEAYVASPQPDDVYLIGGEASEFGLKDGYVVPIYTLERSLAAVSFGGPTTVTDVAELASLHFAASYAVGSHLHRKATRKRLTQALTPREYDCLLWAGEGKTDWEISMILGISRSTVLKHVASARQKLGAVNKAHAIATALRIKLLG
jgi:LuxR family transcriptional regulator, quorum-sensing system regulator BjaR1